MRKTWIWVLSLLVLLGAAFGFWSISNRAYSAENALEANYQRGFYNFLEYVNNINILISKSMVTSSNEQRIMTLTTIWHQAEWARDSLSELPLGNNDMTNSQKFFAQLSDLSYNLARKLVMKEEITEKEWSYMETFRKNLQSLNRELRNLQDDVSSGRINWETKRFVLTPLNNLPKGMTDNFAAIDQKLKQEAPTITYDGPFSDHVENVKPKALTGDMVNESQALDIARNFVDNPLNVNYNTSITGRTKGTIPSYNIAFTRKDEASPEVVMDVSQKGGHVVWLLNTRRIEEAKLDLEQAVDRAESFLNAKGYKGMEVTGSLREDNSITITFVPKAGNILLYPDFIKVEVALDNGQIVGFDAVGYLTNHGQRSLPAANIKQEEIMEQINPNIKVNRIRLALISTPSLKEILCYEVDGKLKDERYLIYINAENGREEQILKVVETENGTMTM